MNSTWSGLCISEADTDTGLKSSSTAMKTKHLPSRWFIIAETCHKQGHVKVIVRVPAVIILTKESIQSPTGVHHLKEKLLMDTVRISPSHTFRQKTQSRGILVYQDSPRVIFKRFNNFGWIKVNEVHYYICLPSVNGHTISQGSVDTNDFAKDTIRLCQTKTTPTSTHPISATWLSSKPPTRAESRGTGCAIYSGAIRTTNKSSTDFV